MIEALVDIDQQLFHIVNEGMANPVLDVLCPILRNKITWIPAYVVVAYFFYRWYGIKALALLAMAGITIALSDQISATFIKQHFHRLRPCNNVLMQARALVPCGGGYSFVSSHAANHFALAMYISLVVPIHLQKKWAAFLFPWAAIIAFSQVYVGVHYPADVTAGAILGILIGLVTAMAGNKLMHYLNERYPSR